MKNIMLIPLYHLPIPSVKGGAIETLATTLIEENEKEGLVNIVCTSLYDKTAACKKYKHTKIIYFDSNDYLVNHYNLVKCAWIGYNIWIKLFHNRLTVKLFGRRTIIDDFKLYQYYWIIKKYHIHSIVLEGREDERFFAPLNYAVGENNIYTHIHFERKEDLAARKCIHNSISISAYIKKQWVVDTSIQGKNEVLLNGIDIDQFGRGLSSDERLQMRNELKVSESDILVFFCARIYPGKGVKELLDCFELLKDESIKLLLIGDAPVDNACDLDYANVVLSRAENMDNVIPLGYISNNLIYRYYSISDMVVIPSICEEGAGLVALEGMAAGLPLIITKSGGMVEYVTDKTAIQLPISENLHLDLYDAIMDLSTNKKKRQEMGNEGRIQVLQFTNHEYYHNYIKVLLNDKGV